MKRKPLKQREGRWIAVTGGDFGQRVLFIEEPTIYNDLTKPAVVLELMSEDEFDKHPAISSLLPRRSTRSVAE